MFLLHLVDCNGKEKTVILPDFIRASNQAIDYALTEKTLFDEMDELSKATVYLVEDRWEIDSKK